MIKLGDMICLKSNPELKGAVIGITEGKIIKYSVFSDNRVTEWYEDQVILAQTVDTEIVPKSFSDAYITSLMMNSPEKSSLYSIKSANIDYIPYQFRPVLKMLNSDRHRILIADGVGVGKTIETGIIIQEFSARHMADSVLVICPKPLVSEEKWLKEMKRFGEDFVHIDGKTLRYCIDECELDEAWPSNFRKCIIPYSILDNELLFGKENSNKNCLAALDTLPHFDLVIVDEAHHIRNQNTTAYKAVKHFIDNADAAVLLTATPIQLHNYDLFVLLNLIRPDYIIDRNVFEEMSEPNFHITQAVKYMRHKNDGWQSLALNEIVEASETDYGKTALKENPDFISVIDKLNQDELCDDERVSLITKTERLHTFDSLINRTRRRDIGEFTIRRANTVTVEFSEEQKVLYNEIVRFQSEIMAILHGERSVKFLTTTIRRQASSCIFGLKPFISSILTRHMSEILMELNDGFEDLSEEDFDNIEFVQKIRDICDLADNQDCSNDSKYLCLKNICQENVKDNGRKVMVFSSFRHTLKYLSQRLTKDGFSNAIVDGTVPDLERVSLKERFKSVGNPDSLDVLLFSEVGCEGLDYQFCNVMVNYDLPWNPMKVEQRIGRIDRNGQESEYVTIYNFITPDTIEADIYERCLMRIGIFEHAIGENEDILGEISSEIQSISNDSSLTDDEKKQKLQQMTDNKIRLINENREMEEKQSDLFSVNQSQKRMNEEVEKAENYWLSPSSMANLVNVYLKNVLNVERDYIHEENRVFTIRLSKEHKGILLKSLKQYKSQCNLKMYNRWREYLREGNQYCKLSFYNEETSKNDDIMFINAVHPLVVAAYHEITSTEKYQLSLKCKNTDTPAGKYTFGIYRWKYTGLKDEMELVFVSDNEEIEGMLPTLMKYAVDNEESTDLVDSNCKKIIEDRQYSKWQENVKKYKTELSNKYLFKIASLNSRHQKHIATLQSVLDTANDERVIKMKSSELKKAEQNFYNETNSYKEAIEKADIITELVCMGQIIVGE